MAVNTIERVAVQATVLDHDRRCLKPVIRAFAGITSWALLEGDGFVRWFHRPGEVVLGVWRQGYEVDDDTAFRLTAPEFEVALPLDRHASLLLETMATGRATLAVLEWPHGPDESPRWGTKLVSAEGLEHAIQLAMSRP